MIRRCASVLAAAVIALAAGSCRDQGPGPSGPGALRVRLTIPTPNSGADAAVLFTLTGPSAPTAATAGAGLQVYHTGLAPATKYAIVGTLTNSATILTVQVPDMGQQYSATLEQVAAANYQLRAALTGYALTVVP